MLLWLFRTVKCIKQITHNKYKLLIKRCYRIKSGKPKANPPGEVDVSQR